MTENDPEQVGSTPQSASDPESTGHDDLAGMEDASVSEVEGGNPEDDSELSAEEASVDAAEPEAEDDDQEESDPDIQSVDGEDEAADEEEIDDVVEVEEEEIDDVVEVEEEEIDDVVEVEEEEENPDLPGKITFVGVPIGNREDITLRAIRFLQHADVVVCEEYKFAARLLREHNISRKLIEMNEHNEESASEEVIALLRRGKNVSVISDAGLPIFADPGKILFRKLRELKVRPRVIPGVSSVMTALMMSGFNIEQFDFVGFLPRKPAERERAARSIATRKRTLAILEAPYRLRSLLAALVEAMPNRAAAIAMNLTMPSEAIVRGTVSELFERFDRKRFKGEFVVVLDELPGSANAEALRDSEQNEEGRWDVGTDETYNIGGQGSDDEESGSRERTPFRKEEREGWNPIRKKEPFRKPAFGGERERSGGDRQRSDEKRSFGGQRDERRPFGDRQQGGERGGFQRDGERKSFGGGGRDSDRRSFGGGGRDGERRSFGGGGDEKRSFGGGRDGERKSFGGGGRDSDRKSFGGGGGRDGERKPFAGGGRDGERRSFGGGGGRDGERKSFGGGQRDERRPFGERQQGGERGGFQRDGERRSFGGGGGRDGERKSFGGGQRDERRPFGERQQGGERGGFQRDGERRSFGGGGRDERGRGSERSGGQGEGERRSFGGGGRQPERSGGGERGGYQRDPNRKSFGGGGREGGERRSPSAPRNDARRPKRRF